MAQFHFRNVNDAFFGLVQTFQFKEYRKGSHERLIGSPIDIVERPSRNGPVLMIDEPVLIHYEKPRERVLFNAARDANPFFHVFESLWMLAGRNDIAPLVYYAKQIAQYSDNGKTGNGAYGYRWRSKTYWERDADASPGDVPQIHVDQLEVLIKHLKAKPESRRAVLQMWNVQDDLLKIDDEFTKCKEKGCTDGKWTNGPGLALIEGPDCPVCKGTGKRLVCKASKDVCCNLSVMFSLRKEELTIERFLAADHVKTEGSAATMRPPAAQKFLDMTVTNRSNDLIWGCLGANYVHFSFLQEYMATKLGVEVGTYYHFTNNLHVYTESNSGFKPKEWLADPIYSDPDTGEVWGNAYGEDRFDDCVATCEHRVGGPDFDREVVRFIDDFSQDWRDPFLNKVAKPMCLAFKHHKAKQYDLALEAIARVDADDWCNNGRLWLERRRDALTKKNRPFVSGVSGEDSE